MHLEEVPGCADVYTAGAACVFLPESEVINLSPSIRERLTALSKVGYPMQDYTVLPHVSVFSCSVIVRGLCWQSAPH